MGSLTKTFHCTALELRALKVLGSHYFGEVLGKHSDIVGTLSDETLRVVTDDAAFIDRAIELGLIKGCPFVPDYSDQDADGTSAAPGCFYNAGFTDADVRSLSVAWGFIR